MGLLWLCDLPASVTTARSTRGSSVSSPPGDARPDETAGSGPAPGYCVHLHLTSAGRRAFDEEVREWAVRLVHQLELDAHRAHRTDPQYTADDVHAARYACEQRIGLQVRRVAANNAVGAAILVTLASVGTSVMANYLHSEWQRGLFGFFAVAGLVGLVLTWTNRPRRAEGQPD